MKILGVLLIINGCFQLFLNEFTMRIRRIWPWRRDDTDPKRNEYLKNFYRLNLYVTGIIFTEVGCLIVNVSPFHLPVRILIYAALGLHLFRKHPVLLTREFW